MDEYDNENGKMMSCQRKFITLACNQTNQIKYS